VNLGNVLPLFKYDKVQSNIFFLPDREDDDMNVESFDVLVSALRDQVLATPRKSGKKGQVSEKDWYRNAVKIFELIRKSDYITEYLQVVRKLRES
jgi:protein SMG9